VDIRIRLADHVLGHAEVQDVGCRLFLLRQANMSTRTYLVSLRSLEPIRKAIGSKDRALFDAFVVGKQKNFQAGAKEIIMNSPPAMEPGWWNYFVEPLAEHFDLSLRRLPFDEWKQNYVWRDYRAVADSCVSAQ
jgi:hypothetical protein